MLASSDGISSWTPLKPQYTNRNPWANQLWCIDFLTPPTPLTDSLPSLNLLCHSKSDAWFMQDGQKAVWSIPYISVAFFPSLKHNFIAYRSSKVLDCIFGIHQLWQSGFSRVYFNCCCSCWFEAEIIKIGQSSHKMYSNNILNFQESKTILNAYTKQSGNLLNAPRHHHVMLPALISLTLSCHSSLSFIIWQVLRATSHIFTELLYVGLSWSPCFCSAMWWGSIGEHHLWACSHFSSSVRHV